MPTINLPLICLPNQQGLIDNSWLRQFQAEGVEIYTTSRLAKQHNLLPLESLKPGADDWLQQLTKTLDGPTLFIRSGLEVPPHFLMRLNLISSDSENLPPILAFAGNYIPQVNPLNKLSGPFNSSTVDSLIWNVSAGLTETIDPDLERSLQAGLICPKKRTGKNIELQAIALSDLFFIHDPEKALSCNAELPVQIQGALGHTRSRLEVLSQSGYTQLPYFGLDGLPVTLHVTHDWGGGISRWITDLQTHDKQGHHLVLTASGFSNTKQYGQALVLHADGPSKAIIQEYALDPIITDTTNSHTGYEEFLQWIIDRFGIGRIFISSLIGHSLDSLRQKVPTAQILHDFYPASPVLDTDPLKYLNKNGHLLLHSMLRGSRDNFMFLQESPGYWRRLRKNWQKTILDYSVNLIAPSHHVLFAKNKACF